MRTSVTNLARDVRAVGAMPAQILRRSWPAALAAAAREARWRLSGTDGAVDDLAARAALRALACGLDRAQLQGLARVICARLALDEIRRRHGRWPAWKGRGRRLDPLLQAGCVVSLEDVGQTPVPAADGWSAAALERAEEAVRLVAAALPRAQRSAVLARLDGRSLGPAARRALCAAIPTLRRRLRQAIGDATAAELTAPAPAGGPAGAASQSSSCCSLRGGK
jgi:DNA-directed RNA polymerase specialized sigma24 family protein